jgi:serine/threonine protein kinase
MPGKKYEKIGEGAYGCVIQPSLACANRLPAKTYKNKIAKVMLTRHAKKEMNEYALISRADPKKQYYLGKPKTCKIRDNAQTRRVIKTCKRGKKYLKDMRETSLMIMENGGANLSMLSKEMETWKPTAENRAIVKQVLSEFARMLEGVRVFLKHDILHHDVKPQNVVYNIETGRMNFIDFGLMRKRSACIRSSRKSANWSADYAHWSYPLETQFLNRDQYMAFAEKGAKEKSEYVKQVIANIEIDQPDDKFTDVFYVLCSYIIDTNIKDARIEKVERDRVLQDYIRFLLEDMTAENYETVMKRSLDTYDTYGLGMALARLTFSMKRLINGEVYDALSGFAYELVHPNVLRRLMVDEAITKYGAILSKV